MTSRRLRESEARISTEHGIKSDITQMSYAQDIVCNNLRGVTPVNCTKVQKRRRQSSAPAKSVWVAFSLYDDFLDKRAPCFLGDDVGV